MFLYFANNFEFAIVLVKRICPQKSWYSSQRGFLEHVGEYLSFHTERRHQTTTDLCKVGGHLLGYYVPSYPKGSSLRKAPNRKVCISKKYLTIELEEHK